MSQNNQTTQAKVKDILYHLQVLYQNEQIDTNTKNEIVALLSEARKSNDFSKLNKRFKSISYGITFDEAIDELIKITK